MSVWIWLVFYALLFAVLHVVIYRYLDDSNASTPRSASDTAGDRPDALGMPTAGNDALLVHDDSPADEDDVFRCSNCNAANDGTYSYCRNCVTRLNA